MDFLKKYGYCPDAEAIDQKLQILASNLDDLSSTEVLKDCFSFMDLTTLHPNDTVASVNAFVDKVNALPVEYPQYPAPSSICVFSNFISAVVARRTNPAVHATAAAGSFPYSQNFLEVKVKECELAVKAGADEIDVVIALNALFAGDDETAWNEIKAMKDAIDAAAGSRKVVFKVILETGVLATPERIASAALLSMDAGADFVKTSTGKVDVNATPMAAYVMCEAIRRYYEVTGRKVGFKAAGGISTAKDALYYYYIVSNVLGKEWLCRPLFRLGVSRLGNNLMSAIEQKTVKFF